MRQPGPQPTSTTVPPADLEGPGYPETVAAWAAVGVVILGSLIVSLAVVFGLLWLGIVGGVVAAVGGLLGKLLGAMGFGAKAHSVH